MYWAKTQTIGASEVATSVTLPQSIIDKGAAALNEGEWSFEGQPQRRDEIAHAVLSAALEYVGLVDHISGQLSNDGGDYAVWKERR